AGPPIEPLGELDKRTPFAGFFFCSIETKDDLSRIATAFDAFDYVAYVSRLAGIESLLLGHHFFPYHRPTSLVHLYTSLSSVHYWH
uniref:Uncharacterized protein n=1 Tax=Anopheles atroparvus TaxID=41427 RepID=A0AAG5CUT5_ANOAO